MFLGCGGGGGGGGGGFSNNHIFYESLSKDGVN